jgi:hypothetical protein
MGLERIVRNLAVLEDFFFLSPSGVISVSFFVRLKGASCGDEREGSPVEVSQVRSGVKPEDEGSGGMRGNDPLKGKGAPGGRA